MDEVEEARDVHRGHLGKRQEDLWGAAIGDHESVEIAGLVRDLQSGRDQLQV